MLEKKIVSLHFLNFRRQEKLKYKKNLDKTFSFLRSANGKFFPQIWCAEYELILITRLETLITIATGTIFSEIQCSSRSSCQEIYLKECVLKILQNSQ